ncbi:MAG: DUF4830 domain-containing protein [Clostridia bacterium]|nr:DUF4830 domain-containing protein [Clostridia bacterium]
MLYDHSSKTVIGFVYFVLPAVLIFLLAAVFSFAEAADALPDANASAAVAFLAEHGWTVDPASCETAEVRIPAEFGAVYESYNALQRSQGFDLLPLRGQTVARYSFTVTDYPEEAYAGTVRANVLFAGKKIVAADLCSVALDGFIRGVKEEGRRQ